MRKREALNPRLGPVRPHEPEAGQRLDTRSAKTVSGMDVLVSNALRTVGVGGVENDLPAGVASLGSPDAAGEFARLDAVHPKGGQWRSGDAGRAAPAAWEGEGPRNLRLARIP